MEIDDPYHELGLTAEATDAEVKAAWRRLTARWHPDRNASPQALSRIQRINRALEEIRGSRERKDADEAPPAAEPDDEDVVEHAISLSLEEAAAGCVRSVQGSIARTCALCTGSGLALKPTTCAQCGGQGRVKQSLWFPWLAQAVACEACGGQGSTHAACSCCGGSGEGSPLRYKGRIRIPAGVRDGHVLRARVRLQGEDGRQALDVRVSLAAHAFMALEPDGTVKVDVPVDGFAWVAGSWIEVPTPYGLRQMRLQRGALNYRMRGEGFPAALAGPRADCLVTVLPLFPPEWSKRQAALLDELVASNTGDGSGEAGARAQAWARTLAAWQARRAKAD
ncbi:hypothetical protein UC35_05555 [Ramlibacter tataouinensis]|uniref:J domain-containing protein n=1 Tax=Ramlibacter tataouinensis TaxID=94132 RepID=A0A127JZE3_9BURK|nr:hypothetical protein UC35_05555 [Ramlibacter tataouinensis]